MRVDCPNRFFFNPNEKRTLALMVKDGRVIYDVEEGEISGDSASSVELISEEDFRQEARVSRPRGSAGGGRGSRVWMNFPVRSSNYGSDLSYLAWAQAVQSKPLNSGYGRGFGSDERSVRSASSNEKEGGGKKGVDSEKEICRVVIDDSGDEDGGEKEEGELEEGEIDLESDAVVGKAEEEGISPPSISSEDGELEKGLKEKEPENQVNEKESEKEKEIESRVSTISEALKTVTVKDAEKSFPGACSRLRIAFENLQTLIEWKTRVPTVDALIEQTFAGIRALHSVLRLGDSEQSEQNKDEISRLFEQVQKQDSALFSPEQMQEIEDMVHSVSRLSSIKAVDKEKEECAFSDRNVNDSGMASNNWSQGPISSNKLNLGPISVTSEGGNNGQNSSKFMRTEQPLWPKGRVEFGPLIDLHMDYDEGSLPSPTRENPPALPIPKLRASSGDGVITSHSMSARLETEDNVLHPYVTDAVTAVSSYQQKFGRTSFLSSNRLPSPTPSEERDDGDGDSHDEVSSSAVGNAGGVNSNVGLPPPVSTSSSMDGLGGQGSGLGKPAGLLGPGSNPIISSSIKSRDPRLRFANLNVGASNQKEGPLPVDGNAPKNELLGGVMSSRKHKGTEESVLDSHALKRQKNSLMDSGLSNKTPRMMSGSGGWLEDGSLSSSREQLTENMEVDVRKPDNGEVGSSNRNDINANSTGTNGGGQQPPVMGNGPVSLPSLLKDIAVNPTMLMHLLIMEKDKRAAEGRQKPANTAQPPLHSSLLAGSVSSGNITSSKLSSPEQRLAEKSVCPPQTMSANSQSEFGKVRMKPRDPRRVLHSNIAPKNENSVSDQYKMPGAIPSNVQAGKDNMMAREQGKQAVASSHPQSNNLPDIAPQFTTNLRNIAGILSSSQATNMPVTAQNIVQPLPQSRTENLDIRTAVDSHDKQSGTGSACEEAPTTSQPAANSWGDVEHLFEGYDDQQKAAIQRERARRIEEQNKMFAARKLCLVLDLDHTLLNSAKFIEVDKVHDEILRKKEELDREKPQRHLFRFPHMGMWTKLRPGIWNFLEKASKLYELHLYTMGNKYYATEMAKVLDPSGTLFAGRVISRGDDGDPFDGDEKLPKSKDLDGVLGMESAVVIIDDSVRVWPHNKLNLIVVERYTYFPCSRRQFGLPGPSLLEIDHDERPEDGTLASSLAVIERIHQNFFSHQSLHEVDVRNILASEQRKILSGCRIIFSRVMPVGEANPHLHPLWQIAEQFGAVCTNQIDEHVTHVVANSLGTDKVNWALSTGRFVVHPGWVEASALLYRRANERDFAIKI